jgi:hypothetical protein
MLFLATVLKLSRVNNAFIENYVNLNSEKSTIVNHPNVMANDNRLMISTTIQLMRCERKKIRTTMFETRTFFLSLQEKIMDSLPSQRTATMLVFVYESDFL